MSSSPKKVPAQGSLQSNTVMDLQIATEGILSALITKAELSDSTFKSAMISSQGPMINKSLTKLWLHLATGTTWQNAHSTE